MRVLAVFSGHLFSKGGAVKSPILICLALALVLAGCGLKAHARDRA
jgi:hypothetical protein